MHVIREKQTDESFLHHDASMNCAICTDLIEDFDLLGVVLGKKGVLGVHTPSKRLSCAKTSWMYVVSVQMTRI